MRALLGKITEVKAKPGSTGRYEVVFKPASVVPERDKIPEWLNDQTLRVERRVADAREIGFPGDSIILSVEESAKYLYPLAVTPEVAYGSLPERITLELRWWKGVDDPKHAKKTTNADKPQNGKKKDEGPEYTVKANGRTVTGKFAKHGKRFNAEVQVSAFYDAAPPRLPVAFEISCDKMKVNCCVLPDGETFSQKLSRVDGEAQRVENDWYALDIRTCSHAGGIVSLRERGRGVDHFRRPEDFIQWPYQWAGHCDTLVQGWNWSNNENVALTCCGSREGSDGIRLQIEGAVDEGQGIRTSVECVLLDSAPLVLWNRRFDFHPPKKKDEDKAKPEKPKEIIDDIRPVGIGFNAAWSIERGDNAGSRVVYVDKHGYRTVRCPRPGTTFEQSTNWWGQRIMHGGWVVAEHPQRREFTMYLFDPGSRPDMTCWFWEEALGLQPSWRRRVIRPGEGLGVSLGIVAGEVSGSDDNGAWVACRRQLPDGGVRCALVARMEKCEKPEARFRVGRAQRSALLTPALIPGLGVVHTCTADIPSGTMDKDFHVTVDDISGHAGKA